ncbi:MAG: ABC transporter permease, partial [Planctomycetota bacterium]
SDNAAGPSDARPPGETQAGEPGSPMARKLNELWGSLSFRKLQRASIVILLVALCIFATIKSPTFFTWINIVDNLLTNAAALGIIAFGMTFVMIGGGFDLSVASTTAVCSVVLVMTMDALSPCGAAVAIPVALVATALVGIILGAVNGGLIAYVGVNPFVVTLSTMLVFRGIALVLTGGGQALQVGDIELRNQFNWVYDKQFAIFEGPGQLLSIALLALAVYGVWTSVRRYSRFTAGEEMSGRQRALVAVGGAVVLHLLLRFIYGPACRLPLPIVVLLATLAAGVYLLNYTRFGHWVFAIGGNEEAAWLAGVNTHRIKAITYTMLGFCCAVASFIFVGMTATAQAESHQGKELSVIASVIVGGTPLGGGSGGLGSTFTGILLLRVIDNLLTQFSVGAEYRKIVAGLIILVVVTVDVLAKRRSRR